MVEFFVQAEDGIRYLVRSRGLGDVYKRQEYGSAREIYDPWFGALVSVVPDDARDRELLTCPDSSVQFPWFDEPNSGLPPLWPSLALKAKRL